MFLVLRQTRTSGEKTTGISDELVVVPEVFVEYAFSDNGLSFGFSYIPFERDVSDKTKSRTDTETSVTG